MIREIRFHESGQHKPGLLYTRLYCRLYEVTDERLYQPDPPEAPASVLTAAPLIDMLALAWMTGRLDQRVDRRTLLQLAATVTTGAAAYGLAEPAERLARALTSTHRLDTRTVEHLEARTTGFHSLEGHLPARTVYTGVMAHLGEVSTLLEAWPAEPLRRRLIVTAGESAVLGLWLAWELHDRAQAAELSHLADLTSAKATDPTIAACALGYRSYMSTGDHRHVKAYELLADATTALPQGQETATRAWLLGRQAEEAAMTGDGRTARGLLDQAAEAFALADVRERPWTRFLDPARFGSLELSVYSRSGDAARAERAAAKVARNMDGLGEHKKLAVVGGEIALACIRLGDITGAIDHARTSLAVTQNLDAPLGWGRLDEVVKALAPSKASAARTFREEYSAIARRLPPSSQL